MDNLLVSKSIAEQQLNNISDHIDDVDKPLAVTKTHSCHVAMDESLKLFCLGSNSSSYDESNGLVEQIFKERKKESPHALDNSSSLASSADSSDSGIDPSCISGDKTTEIVDQLLTTKRSDGESNGLTNVTESLDSASELETISISTSYGESSCVGDQSLALKRDIESSEMVNQTVNEILVANSDQNVAVVDVVHETLSPARLEIDIILNCIKHLFVEQPLTAGSVDDSYNSNSDEWLPPFHGSDIDSHYVSDSDDSNSDEWLPPFHGSDIDSPYVSDSDDSNSDEWVPPFHGSEIDSPYVSDDSYEDDSYEGDYDSDDSYSDDGYHHRNEEFELNDEIRAQIRQYEIRSNTSRFSYANGSSGRSEIKCPICLAPLVDEEDVRLLPCCHLYHAECVDGWFAIHDLVCPNCKVHIKSATEHFAEGF